MRFFVREIIHIFGETLEQKMDTNNMIYLKSATIIQYTIKGRFMSR